MHNKEIAMCYATEDTVSIFKGHMGVGCINRWQTGIRNQEVTRHEILQQRHPQKSITVKVGICTGWGFPDLCPAFHSSGLCIPSDCAQAGWILFRS